MHSVRKASVSSMGNTYRACLEHVAHRNVHIIVASDQVAVESLAIFQLDQLACESLGSCTRTIGPSCAALSNVSGSCSC